MFVLLCIRNPPLPSRYLFSFFQSCIDYKPASKSSDILSIKNAFGRAEFICCSASFHSLEQYAFGHSSAIPAVTPNSQKIFHKKPPLCEKPMRLVLNMYNWQLQNPFHGIRLVQHPCRAQNGGTRAVAFQALFTFTGEVGAVSYPGLPSHSISLSILPI